MTRGNRPGSFLEGRKREDPGNEVVQGPRYTSAVVAFYRFTVKIVFS